MKQYSNSAVVSCCFSEAETRTFGFSCISGRLKVAASAALLAQRPQNSRFSNYKDIIKRLKILSVFKVIVFRGCGKSKMLGSSMVSLIVVAADHVA